MVIERGAKETSKNIIIDYENQSTDDSVYFKVKLKPGYLSKKLNGLKKTLIKSKKILN